MKATIRYFLCASLIAANFEAQCAFKSIKRALIGTSFATTALIADLLTNYILYPNPELAISATLKDLDNAQKIICQTYQDTLNLAAPVVNDYTQQLSTAKQKALESASNEVHRATTLVLQADPVKSAATIVHLICNGDLGCPARTRFGFCHAHDAQAARIAHQAKNQNGTPQHPEENSPDAKA